MKLVIMTGGKGTRMGDLTKEIPKPMIKIGDKPVLEHDIILAKKYGITDIIFCNGHLHQVIEDYFGDGSKWGVNIIHSNEKIPLGSSGPLKLITEYLTEPFLMISGDIMIGLNLKKFMEFHNSKDGLVSLAVHPNDHPWDSDVIVLDNNERVVEFLHKPGKEKKYVNLVNAGAFVIDPKVLDHIKDNEFAVFEKDTVVDLINKGEKVYGYNTKDYIKDMGTPQRLEEVTKDYLDGKIMDYD